MEDPHGWPSEFLAVRGFLCVRLFVLAVKMQEQGESWVEGGSGYKDRTED